MSIRFPAVSVPTFGLSVPCKAGSAADGPRLQSLESDVFARINTVQVRFGRTEGGYPERDLAIIRDEMAKSKYGLGWSWLRQQDAMKIFCNPTRAIIRPYRPLEMKTDEPIFGDCEDLSNHLCKNLEARFQGKYKFYVVQGNFKGSLWAFHYYLLGWPATDDSKMKEKLDKMERPPGKNGKDVPDNVLIIDPSYGRVGRGQSPGLESYYFDGAPSFAAQTNKLKHLYQSEEEAEMVYSASRRPLGYSQELDPKTPHPDTTVCFSLEKQEKGLPSIKLYFIKSAFNQTYYDNWRDAVSEGSPLHEILTMLESKMEHSNKQINPYKGMVG